LDLTTVIFLQGHLHIHRKLMQCLILSVPSAWSSGESESRS
jgi:hypothetical protein